MELQDTFQGLGQLQIIQVLKFWIQNFALVIIRHITFTAFYDVSLSMSHTFLHVYHTSWINRNCDDGVLVNVIYFSCDIWFFGFTLVLRPIATFCYKNRYMGFGFVLVLGYQCDLISN